MRRIVLVLAIGAAAWSCAAASAEAASLPCSGDPTAVQRLPLTVDGVATYGYYVLPAQRPRGLVVVAHGYQRAADSEIGHLLWLAQRDGVIAVAMDNHGQTDIAPQPGQTLMSSRGWRVQEGADDSVAAAKAFDRSCPQLPTIDILGVSMGGNTSGLAVAERARRRGGRPLFDYWVDVEGAVNVTETYLEARGDAQTGNAYATDAAADIEQEMGGQPQQVPDAYRAHTVVARADDIKASGLRGVVYVHAIDDGLVPHNQTRELEARLHALGVAGDVFSVATRGSGESGTTLSGDVLGAADPSYTSPFAGHGSESSFTQLVVNTGYARLDALLRLGQTPGCLREFVVDGDTGTTTPDPTQGSGCGAGGVSAAPAHARVRRRRARGAPRRR